MKSGIIASVGIPLFLLASCKDDSNSTTQPASETASPQDAAIQIDDIDRASAVAFAKKFEQAVESRDVVFLKEVFDFEQIIEDSLSEIELPSTFWREMRKGMKQGRDNAIQSILLSKVNFVEYRTVNGKPWLLFRFRVDGGMDYIEYQINKTEKDEPGWVISDAHTHSTGRFVSDLLRSMLLPALAEQDPSLVTNFLSGNPKSQYTENIPKISTMLTIARNGGPESGEQALRIWETIPEEARKDKFAMVTHILALSCLSKSVDSSEDYLKAVDDLEQVSPDDPSLALMAIDQSIIRSDFNGARKAIKTLRKSIPDPYLDFYVSYVDLHEEKFDSCESVARAFIAIEPEDREGYEMLLESGYGADNHEVTAEALTKLEAGFGKDYSNALTGTGFERFIASEAGKKWATQRKSQ